MTRMCPLLTVLPQNVDCIVVIESLLDIFTWKCATNSITFVSMAPQNVDDMVALEVCQHRAPHGVAAGVRFRVAGADMVVARCRRR